MHGKWINADDVDRLVRELDVAWNGVDGAAPQAALCDIVAQIVDDLNRQQHQRYNLRLPQLYTEEVGPPPGTYRKYAGFRPATPSEIGAMVQHLHAGKIVVRVGKIEIDCTNPTLPPNGAFLIGQDASLYIDDESYSERTGLTLASILVHIKHNEPIKIIIEGTPKP